MYLYSILFRLYWKTVADTSFHQVDVPVPVYTIDNLSPNSQYIVYIVAMSKNGKSLPSETLIAWTDPAYPAFVEVRSIFWYENKLNTKTFICCFPLEILPSILKQFMVN
jgi:hypothetical protein